MKLIQLEPNESGGYPPIQEGDFRAVPPGMAVWLDGLSTQTFYDQNGFVTLTVEDIDGVPTVAGCEPDAAARTAWEESRVETAAVPTEQEDTAAMLVDHEYRLTLLELGLTEGGE